jgi:glycosyltransferase involved in cell wall biosynthesis
VKILHLYSDWKWTGPSEPVLNLCKGLKDQGLDIHLACLSSPAKSQRLPAGQAGSPDNFGDKQATYQPITLSTNQLIQRTLPDKAIEACIPLLTLATPPKYLSLFYIRPHIKTLAKYISQNNGFDIIHCHSGLDHYYAARLKKKFPDIRIIRTNHKGYPLESSMANKSLMANAINGYITLSVKLAEADQKNFCLAPEQITVIPSGIDISVFTRKPQPVSLPNIRQSDIIIGIVARVQRHRRFNIILQAMKQAVKKMPQIKLVIVGRGTHYNELITKPVKRLGLGNNISQAGYRTEDYLDTLSIFDFGIFLVPGSDGSCRAALEIMASGKPLIAANRGILPEIVDHDQNGLVIDDTADNLAQAILKLAKDAALRERLSQSARQKIAGQFSLDRTVKLTRDVYQNISK